MPLTTEQRIELLKKAREAKAKKKEERDAEKPTPVKGRPKKEVKKTLDISEKTEPTLEIQDEEVDKIIEPEVIEEVEVRKIKKPKRRIVRKIIKEQYDSESTEEEIEEVIYKPPKHKSKARVKEIGTFSHSGGIEPPRPPTPPIEPEIRQSKPTLNIFGY